MPFGPAQTIAQTIPFTVGQGSEPELWALISYDDASDPTPTWNDLTPDVRAASIKRGRDDDRAEFDAGTADVTLDNRTRTYDPLVHASVRPMNRIWLRSQYGGVTADLFYGYAEAYDQVWPDPTTDAVAVARCADEFKVLAQIRLPVMDPPTAQSYADVVMYDNPVAYWKMDTVSSSLTEQATVGPDLLWDFVHGAGAVVPGAIIGDNGQPPVGWQAASLAKQANLAGTVASGDGMDTTGKTEMALSFWFNCNGAVPAATFAIFTGPLDAGGAFASWWVEFVTGTNVLKANARTGGTTKTASTTTTFTDSAWRHVVMTIESGSLRMYVNGVQEASSASTATFATMTNPTYFHIGDTNVNGVAWLCDDVAVYSQGLPAARVAAQYTAGVNRGFPYNQKPGERLTGILDAASSHAPRSLELGSRVMPEAFMVGQDPLSEMRMASQAQAVSPMLFVDGSGIIVFYASRAIGITTDVWGDAGGSELPYEALETDYSDSFLVNEINASGLTGTLISTSDATSVASYGHRQVTLGQLPVRDDSDVTAIIAAILTAAKDPRYRLTRMMVSSAIDAVATKMFSLDVGDTIQVKRTPPGGGSRISQTALIQSVGMELQPDGPWRITWGISAAAPAITGTSVIITGSR